MNKNVIQDKREDQENRKIVIGCEGRTLRVRMPGKTLEAGRSKQQIFP